MVESIERVTDTRNVGGALKNVDAGPVLVALGTKRVPEGLSCKVLFVYGTDSATLVPGPYPLSNGLTVRLPEALTARRVHEGVTLEVTREA